MILPSLLSIFSFSSMTWAVNNDASKSSLTPSQKENFLKATQKIDETFQTIFEKRMTMLNDNDRRVLQAFEPIRECGEMISIVKADEIRAVGDVFVQTLFPDGSGLEEFRLSVTQTLLGPVKYDLQVFKACMSCEQLAENYLSQEQITDNDHEYAYGTYCNEEDYGYDAMHSALVFLPTDPETNETFTGKLNAHMNGRGSALLLQDSCTSVFPNSVTDYLTSAELSDIISDLSDYLTAFVYASAGTVVISPDFIGYGESYTFDRTFLFPKWYAQSYANSFFAAKSLIKNTTNGCTELANTASIHGFSEGGTASVAGAFALEQLGVTVTHLHLAAAPLDGQEQFSFSFKTAQMDPPLEGIPKRRYDVYFPFIAYAFSKDYPGIPNSGIAPFGNSEYLVSGDISRNLHDWFDSPGSMGYNYLAFIPNPVTDAYNPAMIEMFNAATADGVTKPCYDYATTNETIAICDTLIAVSVLDDLDAYATFPVTMCYSDDDTLVPTSVAQDYKSLQNPNIMEYMPSDDYLSPVGDHRSAQLFCSIPPIYSLATPGSIVMEPLSDLPAHCPIRSSSTSPPTLSPSMTPPVAPNPTAPPVASPSSSSAYFTSHLLSVVVIAFGPCLL